MTVFRNIKDGGSLNGYPKEGEAVDEQGSLKEVKRENESALEWVINRHTAYVNTII